jgi:hypothetical protein
MANAAGQNSPTDGVANPRMKKRIFRSQSFRVFIRGIATLSVGINNRTENMPEISPITPETVAAIASQSLGLPLTEADVKGTADMLNALATDMQAFRKMALGDDEPATTYAAVEGQP